MAPRRTLAEIAPDLGQIYSVRNPVPFDAATLQVPSEPWWACPRGHEWRERTATRRNVGARWKGGSVLACPHCEGILLQRPCGHVSRHQPGHPGDPESACWDCQEEKHAKQWSDTQARWDEIDGLARSWLAQMPIHEGPETLLRGLRRRQLKTLRKAAVAHLIDGNQRKADRLLTKAKAFEAADPLPNAEVCAREFVVDLGAKMAWGPGMARYLGWVASDPRPSRTDLVASLSEWFRGLDDLLITRGETRSDLRTADLTASVEAWTYAQGAGRDRRRWWQKARELTVPVISQGKGSWGRVDLVVRPPEGPDFAIEIDRTDNQDAVAKLEFAAACGAGAIWLRSGEGPVRAPSWLPVIDLRPIDLAARARDNFDLPDPSSEEA